MGMFDTIFCKTQLPLTEELKNLNLIWEDVDFQTKDLDNGLLTYTISQDNTLIENVVEYDYVPYTEEEKRSNTYKAWSVWKSVNIKNRYDKIINHHGTINFYTSLEYSDKEDIWVEFIAFFVYGKLDKIELFDCHKNKSTTLCNKEIEEKFSTEQKKFKNILKKYLRYFGWGWFWRKISYLCRRISTLFSKLDYFIIRNIC